MRTIKFKVWDNEKSRMSKDVPVFCPIVQWSDGDIDMPIDFALAKDHRFMFLQYCDQLDKKGAEIFEGDILYSTYEDKQEEKGYVEVWNRVVFQDGAFGWIGETTGQFQSFHDEPISAEVVGNICQNPELLRNDPSDKLPEATSSTEADA